MRAHSQQAKLKFSVFLPKTLFFKVTILGLCFLSFLTLFLFENQIHSEMRDVKVLQILHNFKELMDFSISALALQQCRILGLHNKWTFPASPRTTTCATFLLRGVILWVQNNGFINQFLINNPITRYIDVFL